MVRLIVILLLPSIAGCAAERVTRSFPAEGVKTVVLRAARAESAEVMTAAGAAAVEVSGVPEGGAQGYHPSDASSGVTPAAERGMNFVAARYDDVLVISGKGEIRYIHHLYLLDALKLRVPKGVEVVRQPKGLTADGKPDVGHP